MCANLNAHFPALVVIVGSIRVVPIYIVAVYVFSGASQQKVFIWTLIIYGLGLYKPINWHLGVEKDMQPVEAV